MAIVSQAKSNNPEVDDEAVRNTLGCALALGIAYSASIGGVGTPVGTPPNLIFMGLLKQLFPESPDISFLQWMIVGVPLAIVFIPITWYILAKRSFHLDDVELAAGGDVIAEQLKELGPMNSGERRVLIIFMLTALLWIFRSPLDVGSFHIPGWSELFEHPKYLHDSTVAIAMATLLFMLHGKNSEDKKPLLDMPTARKVPWDVLFLIGGGYSLASAIRLSGLASFIADKLTFMGGIPIILLILLIVTVIIFMTEVMTNSAISDLMLTILGAAAVGMGVSPLLLMVPTTIAASCAFMLPSATAPNAIVFSSGHVTIPQMARTGLWLNMIAIFLVTGIVYLIAIPIFSITLDAVPDWAR